MDTDRNENAAPVDDALNSALLDPIQRRVDQIRRNLRETLLASPELMAHSAVFESLNNFSMLAVDNVIAPVQSLIYANNEDPRPLDEQFPELTDPSVSGGCGIGCCKLICEQKFRDLNDARLKTFSESREHFIRRFGVDAWSKIRKEPETRMRNAMNARKEDAELTGTSDNTLSSGGRAAESTAPASSDADGVRMPVADRLNSREI